MLAFLQGKIFRVRNLHWNLILARSWCRVLLIADYAWALTRAESILWCSRLNFSGVLSVRTRARYLFFSWLKSALQFYSHWEALRGLQRWVVQWVVCTTSRHVERGSNIQFLAHMESVSIWEGCRLDIVVTSTRRPLITLDTLALVSAKAKNWRFVFGQVMFRLILNFSGNTLSSKFGFWTLLLRTKTPIWRCLHIPCTFAVVILTWPRNKPVLFTLELVMVHWRHSQSDSFFAEMILGLISAWCRSLPSSSFSHFSSLRWSSKAVLWSISLSNDKVWIIARTRDVLGLFCVCQIGSVTSAKRISRSSVIFISMTVL